MSEKSQKKDSPATHPAVGYVSKPFDFSYNFKDVIVYNLGVGASIKDSHGLQYLYEGHDKFGPIPSFAVIPQFAGKQRIDMFLSICISNIYEGMEALFTGEIPGLDIDLTKVLHGEHYFKIVKTLSYEAKLTNTFKIQVA